MSASRDSSQRPLRLLSLGLPLYSLAHLLTTLADGGGIRGYSEYGACDLFVCADLPHFID